MRWPSRGIGGNGSDAENERTTIGDGGGLHVAHKLWGSILQPVHFAAHNLHF